MELALNAPHGKGESVFDRRSNVFIYRILAPAMGWLSSGERKFFAAQFYSVKDFGFDWLCTELADNLGGLSKRLFRA
jgi:hypothetical protein